MPGTHGRDGAAPETGACRDDQRAAAGVPAARQRLRGPWRCADSALCRSHG